MSGSFKIWPATLVVLALTASCGGEEPHRPAQPFEASGREAAVAEAALRELGRGVFEVEDFRIEDGEYRFLHDAFRYGSSLYDMRFAASIRFVEDVRIGERAEIVAALGTVPVEQVERRLALLRLLGSGAYGRGDTRTVEGSAVFEEVESGWRLAAVDRRWRLVPE